VEIFLLAEHPLDSQEGFCTRELTAFVESNILSSTFSLQLLKHKQSQRVFPTSMFYHKRDASGNFLQTSVSPFATTTSPKLINLHYPAQRLAHLVCHKYSDWV